MKPPLPDRIKALEDANMQLIEKINRMKAQVRHNQKLIERLQERLATEQPQPKAKPKPKPQPMTAAEQNDALAAYFANKKKRSD